MVQRELPVRIPDRYEPRTSAESGKMVLDGADSFIEKEFDHLRACDEFEEGDADVGSGVGEAPDYTGVVGSSAGEVRGRGRGRGAGFQGSTEDSGKEDR